MEIESEGGSRIALQSGSKTVFGRGSGFDTADHTVSRRHLLFETDRQAGPSPTRACFEVLGKNPVWVRRGEDDQIRVYRRSDKGELAVGDWFCVAGQRPVWFALKGIEIEDDDGSERDSGSYRDLAEGVDVSDIEDPVKEFGFLVIGQEFDRYPKQMLRQVKDWDWFLEEPSKNSDDDDDDDDDDEKVRSNKRKKRRGVKGHHEEDNDDLWTGESEDNREDLEKVKKVRKQNYLTRSNSPRRGKSSTQKRDSGSSSRKEEDDDTLGGFIVKDDEPELDEQSEVEEEEEDEFIEDDDDD